MQKHPTALNLEQFTNLKNEGCLVLDTRAPVEVKKGYIPGSISVAIESSTSYTSWIENIVNKDTSILLISGLEKEKDVISKLSDLDYNNIRGYLEGSLDTWTKAGNPVEEYASISAQDFAVKLSEKPYIIDVREKTAREKGVLEGAQLIGMPDLLSRVSGIPKEQPVYVHCSLGGKSFAAYTVLRAFGLRNVVDIAGGLTAVLAHGVQLKAKSD